MYQIITYIRREGGSRVEKGGVTNSLTTDLSKVNRIIQLITTILK